MEKNVSVISQDNEYSRGATEERAFGLSSPKQAVDEGEALATFDFKAFTPQNQMEFQGFISIDELQRSNCEHVSHDKGVYVIVRPSAVEPTFLNGSPVEKFKKKDPAVLVSVLDSKWVKEATVIYIGKASSLKSRIKQYMRFGMGKPVAHWGGRFIWQLADVRKCLVAWLPLIDAEPRVAERMLIVAFKGQYGNLPFANLQH